MRVIWDDDASEKLVEVLEYGRDTFGERAMKKFYARILDYEQLLQSNPGTPAANPPGRPGLSPEYMRKYLTRYPAPAEVATSTSPW